MKTVTSSFTTAVTLLLVFGLQAIAAAEIDFAKQVLPILSNKCFVCHGPDAKEDGFLRLDQESSATADRDGNRAIDRQHPGRSLVLTRIQSADDPMPPKDAEKQLTDNERKILSQWIQDGGNYQKHWAFVRPRKPKLDSLDAATNPIDVFIKKQLKNNGAEFSKQTDKATLARRASLVLVGLPPETDQLKAFLADDRSDAFVRYVDRLFKNPRYGEHQARYWLDAVRYGDTHGLHLDNKRGIYPYRDWVVKAMNDNLSLDKFIEWQIAGDLHSDPNLEQLVATGYVRLNPSTGEGGAIPAEFQMKNNFDRVETLGTVFLGLSLTCARCHNHKYDPIMQSEYYELLAFFNSTAEPAMDRNKYEYGPVAKVPTNQTQWKQWRELEQETKGLREQVWNRLRKDGPENLVAKWKATTESDRLALLNTPEFGSFNLKSKVQTVEKRRSELQKQWTTSLVAKDLPKPRETRILNRGEYDQPQGDPLQPGVPATLGTLPNNSQRNRLGLANWLTSPDHPLVARVLVNRIWQRTFGYGLVRTPEDFGLQGQQPTHPELLDWLAVELIESGWDLQHMLKLMVTSKTFQQSSAWRSEFPDPENRLFGRFTSYRLDAEVLRDIGLWSSGLLDPVMGGEGVKPYQPVGMWKALAHPGSNTKDYKRDTGSKLYRRSLYVYWKRTSPHPMMTLFDAPDRESSCVRRSRTNTSLQSLGLLNETQRIEMARSLATRLIKHSGDQTVRINRLFSLLASRDASQIELAALSELVEHLKTRYANNSTQAAALLATGESKPNSSVDAVELAVWTQVATTVLASDAAILLY